MIIRAIPSRMFALSSMVTPRRIHTASGLALSFSRGCFILRVSMVGEPYGKMIGIGVSGLIVYQFQEMWEGG